RGARELVVLMSLSDAHAEGGPLLVITREENPDARVKLEGLLEAGFPQLGPWRVAIDTQRQRLLVGMPAVVERYKKLQSVPRPDLLGSLEKLLEQSTEGKPATGLVFSPGSDARRVVRELWPTLPKPFDGLTGPLLADDFKYATFHTGYPISLAVETRNEEAAATLKALAEEGRKLLVETLRNNEKMGSPPEEVATMFDSLAK